MQKTMTKVMVFCILNPTSIIRHHFPLHHFIIASLLRF